MQCRPQSLQEKPRSAFPNLGAMSPCHGESQTSRPGGDASVPAAPVLEQHPDFPRLPTAAPLTYHLTMQVCLAARPEDRLTFTQISRLLHCLLKEVGSGSYLDTQGRVQVRGY
jgi:hypothetical protein